MISKKRKILSISSHVKKNHISRTYYLTNLIIHSTSTSLYSFHKYYKQKIMKIMKVVKESKVQTKLEHWTIEERNERGWKPLNWAAFYCIFFWIFFNPRIYNLKNFVIKMMKWDVKSNVNDRVTYVAAHQMHWPFPLTRSI